MARRIKTVSSDGTSSGGGGYAHPSCICNTIHCSPCYITNFTSKQDSTECSMPSEGAQWVTLISQCGSDVDAYSGYCIEFNYDFYNYQEIDVDIILHSCATSGGAEVLVGSSTYLHCCCSPYLFPTYCGSVGGRCCFQYLQCTNCLCRYIHFSATFRPSFNCVDQHIVGSGCQSPAIGGEKRNFGALGSYQGGAIHDAKDFHVCAYNQACGNYCMFWCNFERIRISNGNSTFCNGPHGIDKIHIAGKPYKKYTPSS